MAIYDPKLAGGNQHSTGRTLFGRQQAEQLRLRNNAEQQRRELGKLNDSNAQFWREHDEKTKR